MGRVYVDDENLSDVQRRASERPGKTKWLPELYERALRFNLELVKESETERFRATGRVLAWLDFAEPNKDAECGYKATSFLLQRIARRGLDEKRLKSSKPAASYVDIDVIESLLEEAVSSKDRRNDKLRAFVCNVLGVLGLVRFTKDGEPIPTRVLRKLVSVCRQQDRYRRARRQNREGASAEKQDVDQWLAVRKEVGPRIDPEAAEVACWTAYTIDPYDVCSDLPEEAQTFGLEWFARSARSNVWVLFDDLPGETQEALSEPNGRRNQGKGKGHTTKAGRSKKARQ